MDNLSNSNESFKIDASGSTNFVKTYKQINNKYGYTYIQERLHS